MKYTQRCGIGVWFTRLDMLTVSSARLDSGYDSDLGELDSVYDSELKIFCSASFEDYCRSTAHSLPSSTKKRGKANTSDKAEEPKCYARDFANCSREKFVHLIESVSYKGVKYGVTSAAPSAESVPKYMDLEEQGRYALLALHSSLKRTSTLKEPRMKTPSTEDIESVLSGEYTPPTYSLFEIPGKRVAPPSPTPPEKKVCLEGTSSYRTVSGETVSLQMTSSVTTASCLPVSPSSPTVSASPSPSPSPPPPPVSTSPVSSSPVGASSSTQFKIPGKRVAPPSPTPPEKKVCLEGTSSYRTVSGETVSLQMTSSVTTASCLPVSPSSPTVSASPSPSPSPPPPPVSTSPVSSSPVGASSSTQFKIPGKRVAPPSPTPPEKKVCLEGTSSYRTVSGETVSLQMTSSVTTASCLPVSPSSPTVSASPSPSPSPPPPPVSTSPVSSSPVGASSSTQFKVCSLAGGLIRLKHTFHDDEAISLRNNVGKQLVYELLSYMFVLQQPKPRVRFSTGQDTTQTGGFKGYIVFKGSSQTKLGPPQSTTGTLEYTISGIPDVVVTTSDKSKLLIIAEIKSESEPRSQGAGQLLISAVVNAVKFDCNVMGLLIHPMKVELYEVKKNGRNIEIRRVYTHEELKSSLDLHRLQDALMFMCKFYSNNQ